jgi:hypothetical protein
VDNIKADRIDKGGGGVSGFMLSRQGAVESFCEHDNGTSGFRTVETSCTL